MDSMVLDSYSDALEEAIEADSEKESKEQIKVVFTGGFEVMQEITG